MNDEEFAIEQICEAFEQALRERASTQIEDFLPTSAPLRRPVLWELVATDLEMRATHGQPIRVENYLKRFPELREQNDRLAELLCSEFQFRKRREPLLNLSEYGQRFPDLYEVLTQLACKPIDIGSAVPPMLDEQMVRREPRLFVRCPHCHHQTESTLDSFVDIVCAGCGSTFSLVGDADGANSTCSTVRLGRFELLERVGTGSFGVVWKARDTELDRIVAVKIPRGNRIEGHELESFLREARAVAQLHHPNIASVLEVGREGDTVFIVGVFVEGRSLSDFITDLRLTDREAVEICLKIAEALHHAHEHGVIHRDLKPANILMDREGRPYVTDFGLARREIGEVTLTLDGQLLGTPAYMSPEQAMGDSHAADRRSDIYSLGVILFQLLTGALPFRGNVRMLIEQVINDDPPNPRKLNSNIHRDAETICLKCLNKDPRKRYQDARDLCRDLSRFLSFLPVEARSATKLERGVRWCRRHPSVTLLTGAVVGISSIAFAVVTWQWLTIRQTEYDRTNAQINSLMTAPPSNVSGILRDLEPYRQETIPRYRQLLDENDLSPAQQMRVRLALKSDGPPIDESLAKAMLKADIGEVLLSRKWLLADRDDLNSLFQTTLGDESNDSKERFRAALILADGQGDTQSSWTEHADFVAMQLVAQIIDNPRDYGALLDGLRQNKKHLWGPLTTMFRDETRSDREQDIVTRILADFAVDQQEQLVPLVLDSVPMQFKILLPVLAEWDRDEAVKKFVSVISRGNGGLPAVNSERLAKQRANAAIALVQLNSAANAWPLLDEIADPSARSYFIDRFRQCGTHPGPLVDFLDTGPSISARRAVYLLLGSYSGDHELLTSSRLNDRMRESYCNDPDSGTHGALRWLLTQWNLADEAISLDTRLAEGSEQGRHERDWFINRAGHTMMIYGPAEFRMGSTKDESSSMNEQEHWRAIDRRFAVAMHETTIEKFRRFVDDQQVVLKQDELKRLRDTLAEQRLFENDVPVHYIVWSQAAMYCNWLSKREGIPEDQWCYVPHEENQTLLRPAENCLSLQGYRLPTEAEWEYVCRAGSKTARFFGQSAELLPAYAWCPQNSPDGTKHAVGQPMPNDFGLFDMYGNALEWCHDYLDDYPEDQGAHRDTGGPRNATTKDQYRVLRGSAAGDLLPPRSAQRDASPAYAAEGIDAIGFRVAKTIAEGGGENP